MVLDWDQRNEVGIVNVENDKVCVSPIGRDGETTGLVGED